ncbi:MAG: hypothetical protein ABI824_06075 [Acidobacteriota bacterium]
MTKTSEEFGPERELWQTYLSIHLEKGLDLQVAWARWIVEQRELLPSPGARSDYIELVESGCDETILATIVYALRSSGTMGQFWNHLAGPPEQRIKFREKLEAACDAIELFVGSAEPLPEEGFTEIGRIAPTRLVAELRILSRVSELAELLASDLRVRSLEDLFRLLLVSYVKRSTGRWRDRNCSALIGEVIRSQDYDEVAQRMWRHRNFDRLPEGFKKFTAFLFAMGRVVDLQT